MQRTNYLWEFSKQKLNTISDTSKKKVKCKQDLQKNRRISDNLLVLDYCVKESFKRKKPLYLISIDFQKAFDSIKRVTLIYALKKYRIHPLIIDFIANIYSGDKTQLYFNNIHQQDINITSGAMDQVAYFFWLHI